MHRIGVFVLFGFTIVAAGAGTGAPVDEKGSQKEPAFVTEFRAVNREVEAAPAKLYAAAEKDYEAAQDENARRAVERRIRSDARKILSPAADKVMTAVRPHVADPAAVEALIWVIERGGESLSHEAAKSLTERHAANKLVIDFAYRNKRAAYRWNERLLRAQLAAPDLPKADRPRTLLALAMAKKTQSQLPGQLELMTEDEWAQMKDIYGKETSAGFRKIDVAAAEAEAVKLFGELEAKHGAETLVRGLTFGGVAKSSVFEIRRLAVGKTAPDIDGADVDGAKFKLSDYRGRVVMLSFWGTWCGPCMGLVPRERELVARFKDKPFALIGVNSDTDKTKLKDEIVKAKIAWRSFWCGPQGPEGEIPTAWNVNSWPTIYVLDHEGVIRAKQVTGPALDRVLDKLVAAADAKK